MILPETFVGELFETALADLVTVVRAPDHPDAEQLYARARDEVHDAFSDPWGDPTPEGATRADATFRSLLAFAELVVARGWELT